MMTVQANKTATDIDQIDLDAPIFDPTAFRLNDEQAGIIATVAVPLLTTRRCSPACLSSHSAIPASLHTPATIPKWSRRSVWYSRSDKFFFFRKSYITGAA